MRHKGIHSGMLFLMSMVFYACSPSKSFVPAIPANHVEFGYMNRLTGGAAAYILDVNGQLYQGSTAHGGYTLYRKIKVQDAGYIYACADQLKQSNSNLYKIGDITLFVRITNGIEMQEWKWVRNDDSLPADIKTLDALLGRILDNTYTN